MCKTYLAEVKREKQANQRLPNCSLRNRYQDAEQQDLTLAESDCETQVGRNNPKTENSCFLANFDLKADKLMGL